MSHTPTDDERICAWFESQTEEFLRDLFDRFDAVSPRQCWNAFFNDCSSPAPESLRDSLAAPAEVEQGDCIHSSVNINGQLGQLVEGWVLHPANEGANLVARGAGYRAKFYKTLRSANAAKGYWEHRGAFFDVCFASEHFLDGRFSYTYFHETPSCVQVLRLRPFGGRR